MAVLLLAISLALPVRVWRTGERPAPLLPLVTGGPFVSLPHRIWIDTDAACGHGRTTDPDDCFALLLLAHTPGVGIVGVSTVHGNAPLEITDRTTRQLMAMLRSETRAALPVYRGLAQPAAQPRAAVSPPALAALQSALGQGPLTLLALGPLTNVAAALHERPDLQARVSRLVAVMGRRPGHLFHPAEGKGNGMLFGHGPVFRDFNFEKDRAAAEAVLTMRLPMTLVPYDAAREILLTAGDLRRLQGQGGTSAWVAARAWEWLDYWKDDVGRDGFYPFDLLAAGYVLARQRFDCAATTARVGRDWRLWGRVGLLVGFATDETDGELAANELIYCPRVAPDMHGWLISRLVGGE